MEPRRQAASQGAPQTRPHIDASGLGPRAMRYAASYSPAAMARTYPRASVCTGQAYWHLIWRRQYSASGISAVNRIAAACVMMFFDTVLWGMEAVTQVTFAAQFNQQDLIFGIMAL